MTIQSDKKNKVRSPNFPALPLERGRELTKKLLDKYAKSSVAWEVATKALDYSPKSSAGMQTMAALSYYGLIKIDGKGNERRVKVTDLAYKIIMDKRDLSNDRDAAIKEAAMNPTIFKKIKEAYPEKLPDDSALEYDLTFSYKFNPSSVKEFIGILRKNVEFANMYEIDIMPDEKISEETGMTEETNKAGMREVTKMGVSTPSKETGANEREKAIYSLGGDLKVRIVFSGNSVISSKSIEKLMKLLEINKEDFIEEQINGEKIN